MEPRRHHVVGSLLFRPWLGVPLGMLGFISFVYYWWLISKVHILDTQHQMLKNQARSYQEAMRVLSVDSLSTYKVPQIPDKSGSVCETIHISIVFMGATRTRYILPMLKSILHYRQNPLHFHFIVDGNTDTFIRILFDTWNLPDVKYTCYNGQEHLYKVSWIPNTHYSGAYSLIKLLLPSSSMFPVNLTKTIMLDSDLTFFSDIAELWAMFRNMTDEQFLGLVENESDWYYEAGRWPALGRGFNTGVMLLNHEIVRTKTNWTALWQEALQENLKKLNKTTLADQDVINAIIKKYPSIVYVISCRYNVQMSTKTLAKNCYAEDPNNVKILHWNNPRKYAINLQDANYFRSRHHAFVNLDGNLLREKLHRCWHTDAINLTDQSEHSDLCLSFRAASRVTLRTHVYALEFSYRRADDFDVTLVLQLSMDRLPFLVRLANYWEGPLSAAIYLADCDVTKLESFIEEQSNTLGARKNIAYHLVFKHDAVHYPVNYLRNVALEHVETPYVFLMDADFVPMEGLYRHLRAAIRLVNPYPQKKCLVVPAFESQRYRAVPPRTKLQLLARWTLKDGHTPDVAPFRAHEWPRGHRATNYTRWATATAPYEVEWEPDYEPYLVVHRSIPKYDTRFSGFGWNKVSHSVELRARGFRLAVLPDAFVLHTTHAPSPDITAFRADPSYRICLALLKKEFLDDLSRKYNFSLEELKSDATELREKTSLNRANDIT